ncbi:MAG TPA: glycosyltransferase, partial [Acidimicrobiales bacterium]
MRVAYTLEQCWHTVPGGTAVAAVRTARELVALGVEVVGVRAAHRRAPAPDTEPTVPVRALPVPGALLYDFWDRLGHPHVQRATGPVDLIHATTVLPPPPSAPLVVTVHDLAWVHEPQHFTRRGVYMFDRGLRRIVDHADLVLASSEATALDCIAHGIESDRLQVVPLGVDIEQATASAVASV